jgi:branched-chain amino acid transport system permease protein
MGGRGETSMKNETKKNKTLRAFLVNPYTIITALAVLEGIYCYSTNDMWMLRILLICNIFALFSVSWDLVGGFIGQISLGHALFFGGAAYVSALFNLHFGIPLIVSMISGVLSAVIFALVLGLPTLRLKGPYLSVVTLVTPMVFISIIYMYPVELGGDCGFTGFQSLANGDLKTQFIITLVVVLISILFMLRLTKSDFGLILKAIREDDFAAEAAGLNITKYKIVNFIISGIFAGLAGVLFVHFQGAVAPAMLDGSMMPIMMTMIGGIGTVVGPIIGSYVITFCNEYLIKQPEFRIIIYSVITILILRFGPEGIVGWFKKASKLVTKS